LDQPPEQDLGHHSGQSAKFHDFAILDRTICFGRERPSTASTTASSCPSVRAEAGERGAQFVEDAGQLMTSEPHPRLPEPEHQGKDLTLSKLRPAAALAFGRPKAGI